MKGLILAAGDGGRLRPLTLKTPKVLLDAGGWPLIHYPINALRSAGVSELAVVVGYQAAKVQATLEDVYPDVTFIYNEDHDGGNALSIGVARDFMRDESFVVCMGDHPIDPDIVRRLLSAPLDGCVLCVDSGAWRPWQVDDATRVLVNSDGYIAEIGKGLEAWSAIDTGVFKMTPDVFPAIDRLMDRHGLDVGISDLVRYLGRSDRPFATCDVSGMFWADVDTIEDYSGVVSLLNYENPLGPSLEPFLARNGSQIVSDGSAGTPGNGALPLSTSAS